MVRADETSPTPSLQTQPHDPPIDDPAADWPTFEVLRLRYIYRALTHTGNNKTRAAHLLGIDRRTLNRILSRERAKLDARDRRAGAAHTP